MSYLKWHSLKESNEEGFTLIELLVVILIIGVLSAIAIPAFMNQRRSANDANVESDVRNAAVAVETYFLKNPNASYINLTEVRKIATKTPGVVLIFAGGKDDFCIRGTHPEGSHYRDWDNGAPSNVRPYVLYQSKNGGIADKTAHISTLSCSTNIVTWN